MRFRLSFIAFLVASLLLALPALSAAAPGKGKPVDGARSLGDPLLPQIGNGGYDVRHYRISLNYDPDANRLDSATTKIEARAESKLKSFSLDFQDLDVSRVVVGGRQADFRQVDARPDLSPLPEVTQPMKLVVTPQPSTRPKAGKRFTVKVRYSGVPEADHRRGHLDRGLDPRLLSAQPAPDLRRRFRRQRADRRSELVPVEQLPDRQGDLRHADPRPRGQDRARRR